MTTMENLIVAVLVGGPILWGIAKRAGREQEIRRCACGGRQVRVQTGSNYLDGPTTQLEWHHTADCHRRPAAR